MSRKLIIDGNAVYEIDETCMLRRRVDGKKEKPEKGTPGQDHAWQEEQKNRK